MYQLESGQITSWRRHSNSQYANYFPGAISAMCPFCSATASFSFSHWHKALHGYALANVHCPVCNDKVRFMLMDHDPTKEQLVEEATLWSHPTPDLREPIADIEALGDIDPRLQGAYESTITILNSGELNATAILARRSLDGMLDSILSEDYRSESLEVKLRQVIETRDFLEPLNWLAETLNESSKVGKGYELTDSPDKELANDMIDLMNLLTEYLFLMPHRAEKFHTRILPKVVEEQPEEKVEPPQQPEDNGDYGLEDGADFEIVASDELEEEST